MEEFHLTRVGQTIITHILILTSLRAVVESVDNQLLRGYTTPSREVHIAIRPISGKTILEELPAIAQNILGDITQVEINLTALMIWILDEGVHHPEFDVLIVGRFEIRLVELPHDTTPTGFGITEGTILVQTSGKTFRTIHIVVISTSLRRIIG